MACSTCGSSKKQQIKAKKAQPPKPIQKVVVTSLPLDRIKPIK